MEAHYGRFQFMCSVRPPHQTRKDKTSCHPNIKINVAILSLSTQQIYKQCVRPIFEYGIVSTITVSETVIRKIQRVQNSFIRLALRLPKYVSARLLHEASGLRYVKERLISVG